VSQTPRDQTQTPAQDFNDNRSPRLASFGMFYQPLFLRLPLVRWHSDFSDVNSSIIACFVVLDARLLLPWTSLTQASFTARVKVAGL